ncbi:hypothetical protein IMG5_194650 [Ichthyophthirius multifiliis]|uniref:Uncharacterized protein n=1 Tax=Ichthyophthirius multifiliis TaxID=5932 RepID=G0R4S8_ICHMU|nr:hypothetical protein IMG5_194650 [Ichthyophthirius multifiliis]EGR27516.1 hypothetical protein IMG5_194650 [Ichthyophthirius multifiliis]|eukprot:XP_004024965.1 hypothetical protein IMG5_194650 [Ichthyophthirius multifiliis]
MINLLEHKQEHLIICLLKLLKIFLIMKKAIFGLSDVFSINLLHIKNLLKLEIIIHQCLKYKNVSMIHYLIYIRFLCLIQFKNVQQKIIQKGLLYSNFCKIKKFYRNQNVKILF